MKTSSTGIRRPSQQGSVAVEMAVILPVLLLILALPLFFARVFWYYSVAEKAAHDAARFLSATTQLEMKTQGSSDGGDASVAVVAKSIAGAEIAEIKPVLEYWTIGVYCNGDDVCGGTIPQTVRVKVRMTVRDGIFDTFSSQFYNEDAGGLPLSADVTMRYVGN
jgi:hypothetical protein